ncbi:hypothetical protein QC761_701465 [Podospora bellae-mahoneyi]|uniref:Uncharacterized protein n=1 Tax=Podospora bellae-mahoneyi TaxID=2093777 RepID=A0ABR0F818_9PEZI|nr:hypothetical protein QC761_701465 [Podospora bellae-mahoneyi]
MGCLSQPHQLYNHPRYPWGRTTRYEKPPKRTRTMTMADILVHLIQIASPALPRIHT